MVKQTGPKANTRPLTASMRGFLITCKPTEEVQAAQELRTLLQAHCPQKVKASSEVRPQKLLKSIATGCKGILFMKLNPGHSGSTAVDPEKVVAGLFAAQERQVRHIAKIWPVAGTCSAQDAKQVKASLAEKAVAILKTAGPVTLDFHSRNSKVLRKEEAATVLSQTGLRLAAAPSASVLSVHVNAV